MGLVDANIVLRYILRDNEELALKAETIIDNNQIELRFEVIAEINYALEKIYAVEQKTIAENILRLTEYSNINVSLPDV